MLPLVFVDGIAPYISLHLFSSLINTVIKSVGENNLLVCEGEHALMKFVYGFEHLSYLRFEFWVFLLLVLDNFLKDGLSFGIDFELKL